LRSLFITYIARPLFRHRIYVVQAMPIRMCLAIRKITKIML